MRLATFVFGGGALLYQAELYIGLAVFSGYVVYDTQVTGLVKTAGSSMPVWGSELWVCLGSWAQPVRMAWVCPVCADGNQPGSLPSKRQLVKDPMQAKHMTRRAA